MDAQIQQLARRVHGGDEAALIQLARATIRAVDVLKLIGALPADIQAALLDETVTEVVLDELDMDLVAERVSQRMNLTAEQVAQHIDVKDMAEYVAEHIDSSDVASNMGVEASDVAEHVSNAEIAAEIDLAELAGEVSVSADAIADEIDLAELASHLRAAGIAAGAAA